MILWRHDPRIAVGMSQRIYGLLMYSPRLSGDEPIWLMSVSAFSAPQRR